MKRMLLATTFIVLGSVSALAGGHGGSEPSQPSSSPGAVVAASSAARSASISRSVSMATGGQSRSRATGGTASNAVTVNNGGGASGGSYGAGSGRAPDVIPPPMPGGNACSVGLSLGGAGQAGGGAAGITWESESCARREMARIMWNMGDAGASKEMLCREREAQIAYANRGEPCETDRQRFVKEGWAHAADGWHAPAGWTAPSPSLWERLTGR